MFSSFPKEISLDTTTLSFPAAYSYLGKKLRDSLDPLIKHSISIYNYLPVAIVATCVTSDEKQRRLPDLNIVEIDCNLTSHIKRTQTSDNHVSAGKQMLT